MKKFLQPIPSALPVDMAILLARLGIGLLMLTHGLPKLSMLIAGSADQFPAVFGMSAELSLGMAVVSEIICSLFLIFGFATRLAVIPLMITMLVAAFVFHANDPFSKQEPALLYLLGYCVLLMSGSGRYSVDYYLYRHTAVAKTTRW